MRISYWSSDVCASDLGDPVAALRIGVGLHRPREADVGNTVVDERDIAYAGLDDRAFAPDDLWARGIVRAEKPAPALLLARRSEEHTSELQSLMRISYAVFCLKKKKKNNKTHTMIIHEL